MAQGGILSLAYLAELAVVVNLAYLEIKSLRYVQKAKTTVKSVITGFGGDEDQKTTIPINLTPMLTQAKNLFSADNTERESSWYIEDAKGEKTRFKKCAAWLYWPFVNDTDRSLATVLVVASSLIIFVMTLLTRIEPSTGPVDIGIAKEWTISWAWDTVIWWSMFGTLSLSILVPSLLIVAGWRVGSVTDLIAENLQTRFDAAMELQMQTSLAELDQQKPSGANGGKKSQPPKGANGGTSRRPK